VPSFVKILPLNTEISHYAKEVLTDNEQRTDDR